VYRAGSLVAARLHTHVPYVIARQTNVDPAELANLALIYAFKFSFCASLDLYSHPDVLLHFRRSRTHLSGGVD
jgi:hypothetical protein